MIDCARQRVHNILPHQLRILIPCSDSFYLFCKHVIDRIGSIQWHTLSIDRQIHPLSLSGVLLSENHNYSHSPLNRNESIVFAQFQSAVITCRRIFLHLHPVGSQSIPSWIIKTIGVDAEE